MYFVAPRTNFKYHQNPLIRIPTVCDCVCHFIIIIIIIIIILREYAVSVCLYLVEVSCGLFAEFTCLMMSLL